MIENMNISINTLQNLLLIKNEELEYSLSSIQSLFHSHSLSLYELFVLVDFFEKFFPKFGPRRPNRMGCR